MGFNNNIDIVKFFRSLVQSLKPDASSYGVSLSFKTKIGRSTIKHYNADTIQKEITNLLTCIIKYIPQNEKVTVLFNDCKDNENSCILTVTNTGVNLFRIMEITASTKFKASARSIDSNSSEFKVEVPLLEYKTPQSIDKEQRISLRPYYAEIGNRLSSHFSNSNSFMAESFKIDKRGTAFLKQANAILSSKLEDNTFTVEEFASEMAISRIHLFRKIKTLTNMSPSQYILTYRLHAAKKLLLTKDLDLNVSDVCFGVGFMSKSHFTRSFKKQFGMLPSQIIQN